MLLPYKDINPVRSRTHFTWILITINVLLFLTYGLPSFDGPEPAYSDMAAAWSYWGMRPAPHTTLSELFTHMFVHGGWLHLIANMLMLYIFGNNLEDALGHFWFLAFYLACGLAGGLAFAFTEDDSMTRLGGASGAIAGVMGGYLLLFPRAKIVSLLLLPNILWPFSIIIRLFWKLRIWGYWPILFFSVGVPAWVFLGVWALLNIIGANSDSNDYNIGYSSHLGGFAAGIVLILLAKPAVRQLQATDQGFQADPNLRTMGEAPETGQPAGDHSRGIKLTSDRETGPFAKGQPLSGSGSGSGGSQHRMDEPKPHLDDPDRRELRDTRERGRRKNALPIKWLR